MTEPNTLITITGAGRTVTLSAGAFADAALESSMRSLFHKRTPMATLSRTRQHRAGDAYAS